MPLRISRFDFGGRPLPSSRILRFGNMGSINAHCSSDNSSRFAIYEKYMTFLQSTSHFFIFEIASSSSVRTFLSAVLLGGRPDGKNSVMKDEAVLKEKWKECQEAIPDTMCINLRVISNNKSPIFWSRNWVLLYATHILIFTQRLITLIPVLLQLCTPGERLEVRVWTQNQVSTGRCPTPSHA